MTVLFFRLEKCVSRVTCWKAKMMVRKSAFWLDLLDMTKNDWLFSKQLTWGQVGILA